MSSNKFWTWTKGSQDTAIVRRKPIPLEFDCPNTTPNRNTSNRTNDSIALQEAAVQSATSLLAVMNNCLNTHLLSTQQQCAGLSPMHGRPRSRTAPPTPLFEAGNKEPVELPGSSPVCHNNHRAKHSFDNTVGVLHPSQASIAASSIEKLRGSPQESHYRLPGHSRQSHDSPTRGVTGRSSVPRRTFTRLGDDARSRMTDGRVTVTSNEDTLVPSEQGLISPTTKSRALNNIPTWLDRTQSPPLARDSEHMQTNSSSFAETQSDQNMGRSYCFGKSCHSDDDLLRQLVSVRASHDAYIASLKETHEREVASQLAYITFLEDHGASQAVPGHEPVRSTYLTIDTSREPIKTDGPLNSDASAGTSLQSFELSPAKRNRVSSEAIVEVASLDRELKLCHKSQHELALVSKERDQLRNKAEKNERRVSQLRSLLRQTRENEKNLKNSVASLQAALESANNERTDALEGYFEACAQVRKLRSTNLLAKSTGQSENGSDDRELKQESSPQKVEECSECRQRTLSQGLNLQQTEALRHAAAEKDNRIKKLEQTLHNISKHNTNAFKQIERYKQQLADAHAERDQYNSLLHTELRRQSKVAAQKPQVTTPRTEAAAAESFEARIRAASPLRNLKDSRRGTTEDASVRASVVERELHHCLKEIVLYKLDIKGYKKDLKQARAKIQELQEMEDRVEKLAVKPVTEKKSESQQDHNSRCDNEDSSGLGISLARNTAMEANACLLPPATTNVHLSTPLTADPKSALSPAHRSRSPQGTDKELPKTPPPSRSPKLIPQTLSSPEISFQRQETLRSASESIISSYAKRSTPVSAQNVTPPRRGRSWEPSKANFRSRNVIVAQILPECAPKSVEPPGQRIMANFT